MSDTGDQASERPKSIFTYSAYTGINLPTLVLNLSLTLQLNVRIFRSSELIGIGV